jgi:hypothetical protein
MKLQEFFTTIKPFLEGRGPYEQAVEALYGEQDSADAKHLAVYGQLCRAKRDEMLSTIFPRCHKLISARKGHSTWEALVEQYCQAHPPTHSSFLFAATAWPGFLGAHAAANQWPAWLGELARFEYEIMAARRAVNAAEDEHSSSLPARLVSTLSVHMYEHDLRSWVTGPEGDRPEAPERRKTTCMFWRNQRLAACVQEVGEIELRILQAVKRGCPDLAAVQRSLDGWPTDLVGQIYTRLEDVGVILSQREVRRAAANDQSSFDDGSL